MIYLCHHNRLTKFHIYSYIYLKICIYYFITNNSNVLQISYFVSQLLFKEVIGFIN